MEIYLTGTDVSLAVNMNDRNGNPLDVASITYEVVNQSGASVIAVSALAGFVTSDAKALIVVPGVFNTIVEVPADSAITSKMIDTFNTREVRTVKLYCLLSSNNTITLTASYVLEHSDPLRVGINSFQALPYAELTVMDIPNTPGWDGASDQDKIGAMVAARNHICQLNFWLLNSNTNWGQDNLNFVPDGSYLSPYVSAGNNSMFIFNGNLALLTPLQYSHLPARFQMALRLGQVAEADSLLGGDPLSQRRQDGLLLESVGDVKQMFRAGKPIELPVSKRALRYLSAFVTMSKRIGRG